MQIVAGIRVVVPNKFAIGVKLNAADYSRDSGSDEATVLQHVREIASWGMIDFIEVSGGNYQNPGEGSACL